MNPLITGRPVLSRVKAFAAYGPSTVLDPGHTPVSRAFSINYRKSSSLTLDSGWDLAKHRVSLPGRPPLSRQSIPGQRRLDLRQLSRTSVQPNRIGGVFLALGSNLGDRVDAIENACRAIDADPDMHILRTSCLYETKPMYVEDQNLFLNGACEISTSLEPTELLNRLQAIENGMGRVKLIDKGPRNIDLDILFYNDQKVSTERLSIPHISIMEREFVLRPLSDIKSGPLHPLSLNDAVKALSKLGPSDPPIFPSVPLIPTGPSLTGDYNQPTQIMSILNTTPDSFSDGGDNVTTDVDGLRRTIAEQISAGATMIDIGGQSSRPNAPDITAEEEIARVLPAIEAVKSLESGGNIVISVDTYRATVARAAVKAGAHVINDISAGTLDADMLPTIAQLGCTYVMMHMRGNPSNMQSLENCSYPAGLISTIHSELSARLVAAEAAGIRRWRVILDPGVGFAKTVDQNIEILRRLPELTLLPPGDPLHGIPWLVGSSRKGFIGTLTGVKNAKERLGGTAATVVAAVQGGAKIVRVHDVYQMKQAVCMTEAICRRSPV